MIEAKDMFGRALFVGAHVAVPQIYAQSATMLVGAIEKVRYTRSVDGRNVECPQVQADRFTLRVRPLVRTARYDRVLRSIYDKDHTGRRYFQTFDVGPPRPVNIIQTKNVLRLEERVEDELSVPRHPSLPPELR